MKKTEHITINLTVEEYDYIKALAKIERRSITEIAKLILVDNAIKLFLDIHTNNDFKPAKYIPNKDNF